jgi:Spy/CpxP family protein refolding chaperone
MAKMLLTLAGLAALAVATPARAQAPAPDMQSLALSPQVGQWVICITSFMGDQSARLAYDLTLELRQRYRLHAYIFNRSAEQRREAEMDRERMRQRELKIIQRDGGDPEQVHLHLPKIRVEDAYAVVVGGYADLKEAHAALETLRGLPAPPQR